MAMNFPSLGVQRKDEDSIISKALYYMDESKASSGSRKDLICSD